MDNRKNPFHLIYIFPRIPCQECKHARQGDGRSIWSQSFFFFFFFFYRSSNDIQSSNAPASLNPSKGHDLQKCLWGSLHPGTCQEGVKHAELESMVYNCSSPVNTVEPLIPKLVFKSSFFLDGEFMDVIFSWKNSNHGDKVRWGKWKQYSMWVVQNSVRFKPMKCRKHPWNW